MDKRTVLSGADPAILRFAERLRDNWSVQRVLLFGSHARGTAMSDSDYDLIVVSEHFGSIPPLRREIGLRDVFYAAGGAAPLDLICLTPGEFDEARQRITLVSAVLPEAVDLLEPDAWLLARDQPAPASAHRRI